MCMAGRDRFTPAYLRCLKRIFTQRDKPEDVFASPDGKGLPYGRAALGSVKLPGLAAPQIGHCAEAYDVRRRAMAVGWVTIGSGKGGQRSLVCGVSVIDVRAARPKVLYSIGLDAMADRIAPLPNGGLLVCLHTLDLPADKPNVIEFGPGGKPAWSLRLIIGSAPLIPTSWGGLLSYSGRALRFYSHQGTLAGTWSAPADIRDVSVLGCTRYISVLEAGGPVQVLLGR